MELTRLKHWWIECTFRCKNSFLDLLMTRSKRERFKYLQLRCWCCRVCIIYWLEVEQKKKWKDSVQSINCFPIRTVLYCSSWKALVEKWINVLNWNDSLSSWLRDLLLSLVRLDPQVGQRGHATKCKGDPHGTVPDNGTVDVYEDDWFYLWWIKVYNLDQLPLSASPLTGFLFVKMFFISGYFIIKLFLTLLMSST